MIFIDRYAYNSKLKKVSGLQKLVFAILTLSVCLWADTAAISLAVLFIMGGVTVVIGRIPARFFLKLLCLPMSFLLIGVFTIAVNISKQPDAFFVSIPLFGTRLGISHAGLNDALHLFFKALGAVSCLYFLSLNTPMVDLLSVLRKLRVPKLLIELMNLVYRFIFVLLETVDAMFTAQNSRLGYASLSSGYRSFGALVSSLFIRAYKRSEALFTALEARGYEGELNVLEEDTDTNWIGFGAAIGVDLLLIVAAILLK